MAFQLKIMGPDEARWVDRGGDKFRLAWFDTLDGEWGGILGDSDTYKDDKPPQDREEWETWAAERAVAPMAVEKFCGFCWESRTAAAKALAVAKLAMKGERPLPEWAKEATAAGWKPPKGWKP